MSLQFIVIEAEERAEGATADAAAPSGPQPAEDIVVADLRGGEAGRRAAMEALRAEDAPAVIVAAEPDGLARALSGRSAPSVVVVGEATDAGYRIALAVCRALDPGRRRGPAPRRARWRALLAGGAPAAEARP
jgi:hypothetical protein